MHWTNLAFAAREGTGHERPGALVEDKPNVVFARKRRASKAIECISRSRCRRPQPLLKAAARWLRPGSSSTFHYREHRSGRNLSPTCDRLIPNSDSSCSTADGKQPEMRGSLVIKRGSVLEVSSPTAQPWIDTNLALVKIEQRSQSGAGSAVHLFVGVSSDSG